MRMCVLAFMVMGDSMLTVCCTKMDKVKAMKTQRW